MKKKLAKLTALILAGTLIFNGMNPISQAKNNDNGRMSEMERQEDKGNNDEGHYICESSVEESVEEPESSEQSSAQESLEETSEGEASETEGASEEGTSETEGTSEEGTSETERTSEEGTSETEETSEEETSETEETSEEETSETEEEKTICINDIQLYDDDNLLYQSSEGIYYTNKNKLKIKLDITETNTKVREIQINDKNVEFQHDGDKYVINDFGIENDICELRILVKTDSNLEANEAVAVVLDTTAPKVKIEHFAKAENRVLYVEEDREHTNTYILYTKDKNFSVEINPSDNKSGISKVKAIINDDKKLELSKNENNASYSYNFSNINIEEDTYIKYEITDNAGNKYESVYKICFDKIAPEIKLDNSEIFIKMNGSLDIEVCDDSSGILKVYMNEDKKENMFTYQDGKYRYVFAEENVDKESKVKECTIYAEDKAGNISSKNVTIKFDFIKPEIKVWVSSSKDMEPELQYDIADSLKVYYTNENCYIKVSATDKINEDDESEVEDLKLYEVINGERIDTNVVNDKVLFVNLETGDKQDTVKQYEIEATDKAGNTVSEKFEVVYDIIKPEVEIEIKEKNDGKGKLIGENFSEENVIEERYFTGKVDVTVKVTDVHFNSKDVDFQIIPESDQLLKDVEWKPCGENQYFCVVTFTADGKYTFGFACTDKAGNQSEHVEEQKFIIDATAPQIQIEYYNNDVKNGKYYAGERWAMITVQDSNFDENSVRYRIKSKEDTDAWISLQGDNQDIVKKDEGMGKYSYTIYFSEDGEYDFGFQCSDLLGHKSEYSADSSFVVDKTDPKIEVEFDNKSVNNGKYYSASRTATIKITEENFIGEDVKIEPVDPEMVENFPEVSAWSTEGIVHTAKIKFDTDGIYGFTVNYSDLAGRQAEEYVSDIFVIDTTVPKATIEYDSKESGNDKYYNTARTATVTVEDANFDESSAQFMITSDGNKPVIGEWVHEPGTIKSIRVTADILVKSPLTKTVSMFFAFHVRIRPEINRILQKVEALL